MNTHTAIAELFTDGACSGNPGPGGWGVIVRTHEGEKELSGSETHTTNNRMEMMAAIEGLKALPASSRVKLYTDSTYLKDGMTSWVEKWKKGGWRTASNTPVKNQDLWQELDQLCADRQVEWAWVKGHSGHPENERADVLARNAIVQEMMQATLKQVRS
jgi:ribonuclease HI